MSSPAPAEARGDLSVTALYTSGTWAWAGLPGADLLASPDAQRVFGATNAALGVARLFNPGLRSLRHSLVHRHTMIDHLARVAGARQILELAAGLSPRGVTFSADPAIRYTEVDLPHTSAHKRKLLERSDAGRAALARPNLRLVAADVTEAPLDDLVTAGEPIFVVAEGLLMYLSPEKQRALWRKLARLVDRAGAGTLVFDLVPTVEQPPPGAVGRALEGIMKAFTRGQAFTRDTRTRHDIAGDVREAGFEGVEMFEPADVVAAWQLPFPDVPTQQLLFVGRRAR
jgi:O-methyltransferase involved in polyketide biosynthesis